MKRGRHPLRRELGREWNRLRHWCIIQRSTCPKEKGRFGDFSAICFSGIGAYFFNRNVFDSCVKSFQYFRTQNISLELAVHWFLEDAVKFEVD